MNCCVVCGKTFTAVRRTKQTCSDSCRVRLYRERKKIKRVVESFTFNLWQQTDLIHIGEFSPESAACIDKIRALAGADVGELALQAVIHVSNKFRQIYESEVVK